MFDNSFIRHNIDNRVSCFLKFAFEHLDLSTPRSRAEIVPSPFRGAMKLPTLLLSSLLVTAERAMSLKKPGFEILSHESDYQVPFGSNEAERKMEMAAHDGGPNVFGAMDRATIPSPNRSTARGTESRRARASGEANSNPLRPTFMPWFLRRNEVMVEIEFHATQ